MAYLRVLGLLCLCGALGERAPLPTVAINDNRAPAGTLRDGVLTLHLDVTRGVWHPDGDGDPGAAVLAFAEDGHAPSIPGPLVRVPVGTEIRTTVRNTLSDSSILVFGLSGARGQNDTVRIRPGETREMATRASAAGTYLYRALVHTRIPKADPRPGGDAMLGGAFVVDPPGARPRDRVLVLFQWIDTARMKPLAGESEELLTINGKTWPHTERMEYQLGDTIHWRVVNASFDTHPMHLHGAFFTVLGRGTVGTDTIYAPDDRRSVVTERLLPLSTMDMAWVPPHAGNWIFHCHLNFHLMAHAPLGPPTARDSADHAMQDMMGGLILGTTVRGTVAPDPRPQRHLRLVVEQHDSIPGEYVPPFSYEADNAMHMTIPGAPIIVQQDEAVAITVVNHAKEPTSVHWHGLEIQSYYDGVAGFDGDAARMTPSVAPNDSFTVTMVPPRAGTFIYHSHYDDIRQQGGGLYGAFIVLPKGATWDPEHERMIIFGEARDTGALKINGVDHPTLAMHRGVTYRLRMINITLARPNIAVDLRHDGSPVEWQLVARDGADLPPHQARRGPARLPITIGQTEDALFTPADTGEYVLQVRTGAGEVLRSASFVVTP